MEQGCCGVRFVISRLRYSNLHFDASEHLVVRQTSVHSRNNGTCILRCPSDVEAWHITGVRRDNFMTRWALERLTTVNMFSAL